MISTTKHPSARKACAALDVSTSGYYDWKKRKPRGSPEETALRGEVHAIALEFPKYGYRRITKELHRRLLFANSKRVRRITKEDNLLVVRTSFKPITTQSNHSYRVYPNLARDIVVAGLNQLWVADITYIRLLNEFVYLAVILDVYSRKVIGWELSRNIDTQLTLNALDMAVAKRKYLGFSKLVHHSDQGVQYASTAYVEQLNEQGIRISMSRKGNPYDNAFAESFMKTLKNEEVHINEYENYEQAYENIKTFIEQVYNAKRLHSGIGYLPPNEYEKEILNTIIEA